MQTVQPSSYTRSSLIAFTILLIVLWGFHRTYTVFFPTFTGFLIVQHFHGFVMLLWLLMLVVQPLFIARKNYGLHRAVGKSSYVVAPLLMASIFLVSRMVYYRNVETLKAEDALAEIALSIPGLITFGVLYALAIINRHRTFYHMRYMIGTGILMVGPGLGRLLIIWFGVFPPIAVTATLISVAAIALLFLLADVIRRQDIKPNGVVTLVMALQVLIWEARYADAWQSMGRFFARTFF